MTSADVSGNVDEDSTDSAGTVSATGDNPVLADLDPLLQAPKRLAIVANLTASTSTDFSFLLDLLQVSESDLSKQMTALAKAGYVKVRKTGHGRGSRTSYSITRQGRRAYQAHRSALLSLLMASDTDQ